MYSGYLTCDLGQYHPHLSVHCSPLKCAHHIKGWYDPNACSPTTEEGSSEHSEVLITDLSLHWLRQHSSYANSEAYGNISNWKSIFCFILFHCEAPEPQHIH